MLSFGCGDVELRFDDHIKLTEIVVFRKVTRDVVKYLEDLYRRTGIEDIRDVIRDFNLVLERSHEFSGVEREYIISKAIEKLDKVRFEIHRKLEEWLRRVGVPEGEVKIRDREWITFLTTPETFVVEGEEERVDGVKTKIRGVFVKPLPEGVETVLDSKFEVNVHDKDTEREVEVEVAIPCTQLAHSDVEERVFRRVEKEVKKWLRDIVEKGRASEVYNVGDVILQVWLYRDKCVLDLPNNKFVCELRELTPKQFEKFVEWLTDSKQNPALNDVIDDCECKVKINSEERRLEIECERDIGECFHLSIWEGFNDYATESGLWDEAGRDVSRGRLRKLSEYLDAECSIFNPMYHHGGVIGLVTCRKKAKFDISTPKGDYESKKFARNFLREFVDKVRNVMRCTF